MVKHETTTLPQKRPKKTSETSGPGLKVREDIFVRRLFGHSTACSLLASSFNQYTRHGVSGLHQGFGLAVLGKGFAGFEASQFRQLWRCYSRGERRHNLVRYSVGGLSRALQRKFCSCSVRVLLKLALQMSSAVSRYAGLEDAEKNPLKPPKKPAHKDPPKSVRKQTWGKPQWPLCEGGFCGPFTRALSPLLFAGRSCRLCHLPLLLLPRHRALHELPPKVCLFWV